jgi:hypothetical protein
VGLVIMNAESIRVKLECLVNQPQLLVLIC